MDNETEVDNNDVDDEKVMIIVISVQLILTVQLYFNYFHINCRSDRIPGQLFLTVRCIGIVSDLLQIGSESCSASFKVHWNLTLPFTVFISIPLLLCNRLYTIPAHFMTVYCI